MTVIENPVLENELNKDVKEFHVTEDFVGLQLKGDKIEFYTLMDL